MKNLQHIIRIVIGMWVISLCTGCVPEPIPIELEEAESLPVVWSQSLPGTGAIVYLAKSFTALSYQEGDTTATDDLLAQMLISDGIVTISHGGETDTLFEVSSGVYATLSLPIVPGDNYTLRATDPATGKTVTSTTKAYDVVSIDSVGYTRIDSATARVRVYFNDPVGDNFYAVHFYSRYNNPLEVDDPLSADNTVVTKLVTDLEFESNEALFSVELTELDSDTLYVSLNNISPVYFDYLGQRLRGGTIYNQLVQEPINYVTNVNGGYGMFTLHLPSLEMIIMEE